MQELLGDTRRSPAPGTLGGDDGVELAMRLVEIVVDDQVIEERVVVDFDRALLRRRATVSSSSLARERRRRSSSAIEGGRMKTAIASGRIALICLAPW